MDEVTIIVKAGDGGNGAVSFRREKYVPKGGPDGGDGGNGGDVYFRGVSDLAALNQFRNKKIAAAPNGGNGGKKKKHGANGTDLIVSIPVGTTVRDLKNNRVLEIKTVGQQVLIAMGGKGGWGSYQLRSPSNTTPLVAEDGTPGEERNLHLNLSYIADVGFIGLPNSGKSSLLNALTNTDVKIGDYPFTTLEPNLGTVDDLILTDIPGLIEGAHEGKGLGIRFLKHIEKTYVLLHCISSEVEDLVKAYNTIQNELITYNPMLKNKEEIILLTKTDLISEKEIKEKKKILSKLNKSVLTLSILDEESLLNLKETLKKQQSRLRELTAA